MPVNMNPRSTAVSGLDEKRSQRLLDSSILRAWSLRFSSSRISFMSIPSMAGSPFPKASDSLARVPIRRSVPFALRFLLGHVLAFLRRAIPLRSWAVIHARLGADPYLDVRLALLRCGGLRNPGMIITAG